MAKGWTSSLDEAAQKFLRRGITRLGVSISEQQVELFLTYLRELKRWNRRTNLVGFRTDEALVRHGILESLSLLKAFEIRPGLQLIDIGSGAGLPGIPLKIAAPDLAITLVEAARKKVSFLKQAVRLLRMSSISIVHARAELLRRDPIHREAYDLVTVRAVARLPAAVTLCTPFLKKGGHLLLPVGSQWPREAETLRRPDLKIEGVIPTAGDRHLLVMVKAVTVSRETSTPAHPERFT